jgi:hypothetical protein
MQLQGENVSEARRRQPGGEFSLPDALCLGLQVPLHSLTHAPTRPLPGAAGTAVARTLSHSTHAHTETHTHAHTHTHPRTPHCPPTPPPPPFLCAWLRSCAPGRLQMLSCVEAVHREGYIHRDVKPSNFVFGLER